MSARNFSESFSFFSWPGKPGWAILGTLLVEVAKRWFPFPPFPPGRRGNSCLSCIRSASNSPVSRSSMTVPKGTSIKRSGPFLPNWLFPLPGLPSGALKRLWDLKSVKVWSLLLALTIMLPPSPPSPPSGPPLGMNFSLLKLMQPFPPSPDMAVMTVSSRKSILDLKGRGVPYEAVWGWDVFFQD